MIPLVAWESVTGRKQSAEPDDTPGRYTGAPLPAMP